MKSKFDFSNISVCLLFLLQIIILFFSSRTIGDFIGVTIFFTIWNFIIRKFINNYVKNTSIVQTLDIKKTTNNYYSYLLIMNIILIIIPGRTIFTVIFLTIIFFRLFKSKGGYNITNGVDSMINNELSKCPNCGGELKQNNKFCTNCGKAIEIKERIIVKPTDFDSKFFKTDDALLNDFIKKEMVKANINLNLKSAELIKRKNIFSIILAILTFVYVSMIFFHFPLFTYIFGLILLLIFIFMLNRFNLEKYIAKEVKARPSEKISNIVMNIANTMQVDNLRIIRVIGVVVAAIIPLIIFASPKIMYEEKDDGYAVRYYIYGLSNFKTATIPEEYNGKPVISLRGNTFSNMYYLEKVSLPDTITEIRGQAFKNTAIKEITLPSNLEYLGGGAFYNCTELKSIELPDSLTYMGGETFYGASSLEYVKLSENLEEIRGDSFEYCTSLEEIIIPDKVTRIGGHAFYGDTALSKVIISENSKLNEIGSSAFRKCYELTNIKIPLNTYVNERAFKESPTYVERYGAFQNYNNYDYDYYNYYNY